MSRIVIVILIYHHHKTNHLTDLFRLADDRDQVRALEKTAVDHRVPKMWQVP
jgi:hypothetical protein